MTPPRPKLEVYTLSVADASKVFGLAKGTLYNWVNNGRLIRGTQYLKIGNRVLIKRQEFIEWMEAEDGCQQAG